MDERPAGKRVVRRRRAVGICGVRGTARLLSVLSVDQRDEKRSLLAAMSLQKQLRRDEDGLALVSRNEKARDRTEIFKIESERKRRERKRSSPFLGVSLRVLIGNAPRR